MVDIKRKLKEWDEDKGGMRRESRSRVPTLNNRMASNVESLYEGYEETERGTLKDRELLNDSVQKAIMSEAKVGTKYTIKMNFRKKAPVSVTKKTAEKAEKITKEKITKEEGKMRLPSALPMEEPRRLEKVSKSFEEMLTRFEQMVQMNQMIQMNQMTQMQMMSHLMELKASVTETRQDLGFKLKELNQKVDTIATTATMASAPIQRGPGRPSSKKSPQQLADSIAATLGEVDDEEDYSHLTPLHKESGQTIMQLREVDDDYIKSLIKAKTTTSFIKVFDYLYKSKEKTKRDIYPIRMIKAKTFQYFNREGHWILDTNGTNLIDIICSNIEMLMTKINNQFFEEEEFDVNDFVDNQSFIGMLDDKKVRSMILNHIRDGVINHNLTK